MNDNTAVSANALSSTGSASPQMEVEGQSEILPNNDDSNVDECEVNGTEQHDYESAATDPFQPKATDEEGLSLEYDVAICGTGLVQSILASALARAVPERPSMNSSSTGSSKLIALHLLDC